MINKPNVLVAGFSRCATTYLYSLLKQHDQIHIPREKEVNYLHKFPLFLSHPDLVNIKFFFPESWYFSKFKSEKPIKIDFSVMTAYDKGSAQRIREKLGDIKIIFITRDKADHQRSVEKTMKNHGEKLAKHLKLYSNFEDYMGPYKRAFSDILIITKEDLARNAQGTMNTICQFLEIQPQKIDTKVYQNKSNTFFKDKHTNLSYPIFRSKRSILKIISYLMTNILAKNDTKRQS